MTQCMAWHGILGPHMWAKWHHNSALRRGHQRMKKAKWLPSPCHLLSAQHAHNVKVATCPKQRAKKAK